MCQVLRSVNRLFAVSHKRNRTSCWFSRLSIFGQSARTIFSPVEGISRKSSVSRSRCRSCHGCKDSSTTFLKAMKSHRVPDRKSTRLNSSHSQISYAVFCLKKKNFSHGRLDEVLPLADFVALPCPLTPQTEGLMLAQALARIHPSAFLLYLPLRQADYETT